MTIANGPKPGPYQIFSQLGAGGMGEVYLAEETRLRRKVALKIQPSKSSGSTYRATASNSHSRAARRCLSRS